MNMLQPRPNDWFQMRLAETSEHWRKRIHPRASDGLATALLKALAWARLAFWHHYVFAPVIEWLRPLTGWIAKNLDSKNEPVLNDERVLWRLHPGCVQAA